MTALIAGIASANDKYLSGAKAQLDYLLYTAPHQGVIISHRNETFQAWCAQSASPSSLRVALTARCRADFISMAPPFIAYAGVTAPTKAKSLLVNAYEQCQGYRTTLQDPSGSKLWRHIIGGSWNDTGLWLTGNAWAAYGMLRVQQTLAKSDSADELKSETADLLDWTNEILNATWARQVCHPPSPPALSPPYSMLATYISLVLLVFLRASPARIAVYLLYRSAPALTNLLTYNGSTRAAPWPTTSTNPTSLRTAPERRC